MLTVNPFKRITSAEALKHPWIYVRKTDIKIDETKRTLNKLMIVHDLLPYRVVINALFFYVWISHSRSLPLSHSFVFLQFCDTSMPILMIIIIAKRTCCIDGTSTGNGGLLEEIQRTSKTQSKSILIIFLSLPLSLSLASSVSLRELCVCPYVLECVHSNRTNVQVGIWYDKWLWLWLL